MNKQTKSGDILIRVKKVYLPFNLVGKATVIGKGHDECGYYIVITPDDERSECETTT